METNKENRIRGGSSFADAMIRAGFESHEYAKIMIGRVIRKYELEQYQIGVYFSGTDLLMVHNDRIFLKMSFDSIEEHRCKGLYSFEREIEKRLSNI